MDDYYDPHPRLALAEPVVLAGHVGTGTAQVARAMAGRSGLPFVEVDRMLEAQEGKRLSRILADEGFERLRRLARTALMRALRRRPCNLVVLGSPAIEAEELREALGSARLVYLRRPADVLLARIQEQHAARPGSLFGFPLAVPENEQELRDFQAPVEAILQGADVVFEAGDHHPSKLAVELLASLDRIVGVERL
ncbi:MAG: shikimate kinase [Myxococcota bacterium]|nr:shikimate kinase [Myxococcota bacterium]